MNVSPFMTSLTISWTLARGLTATTYTITYSNTDTDCFTDSRTIPDIAGSEIFYTITGLEEGSDYSISVTATLSGGDEMLENTTAASTLAAGEPTSQRFLSVLHSESLTFTAPTARPSSVRALLNGSAAYIVNWGPVEPCIHQNGHITGYSVRYGKVGTSERERTTEMTYYYTSTIIYNLERGTMYMVEVAAVNAGGVGVYSDPITIEIPGSMYIHVCVSVCLCSYDLFLVHTCITYTDVYVSLNGAVIPNNGYVDIRDIGYYDDNALKCHTNNYKYRCYEGDWFAPNGSVVQGDDYREPGLIARRNHMTVLLIKIAGIPLEGIYHCSIHDNTFTTKKIYVGIYDNGRGTYNVYAAKYQPLGCVLYSFKSNYTLTFSKFHN